jgi:hypothetical protein
MRTGELGDMLRKLLDQPLGVRPDSGPQLAYKISS